MTVTELKECLRKKNLPVSGNKDVLIKRLAKPTVAKIPANVVDKDLYVNIRNSVKKYASGQVVKLYKMAGGCYIGQNNATSLDRWFKEKWVNVCKPTRNGYDKCGRKQSNIKEYPYCRPTVRINKSTPTTVKEIIDNYSVDKLNKLCEKKRI